MSSLAKKKVTVRSETWFIDESELEASGFLESPHFGTESTQFYWRAGWTKEGRLDHYSLYLYLAASPEAQVNVEAQVKYECNFSPEMETTFKGVVTLDGTKHIGSSTFEVFSCYVTSELTFEETVSPKANKLMLYKSLSSQLGDLRGNSQSADILLVSTVDGRQFPAHKLILASRSTVFGAMFDNKGFKESQLKRIDIDDVTGEVMQALLKYIYSADPKCIKAIAGELLKAADKYDLPFLVGQCAESMIKHLEVSNAAYYFYLADLHRLKKYKTQICEFITANKKAVHLSDGYREFIKPNSDLLEEFIHLLLE